MQPVKCMLDTHTLLWAIGNTKKLSKKVIQTIVNPNNEVYVSAVSLWEIAIKYSIGKLEVDFDIEKIPDYCHIMGLHMMPLDPVDALKSQKLPFRNDHKDPFDRMLVYQCIKNDITLISNDSRIELYKEDGLHYLR